MIYIEVYFLHLKIYFFPNRLLISSRICSSYGTQSQLNNFCFWKEVVCQFLIINQCLCLSNELWWWWWSKEIGKRHDCNQAANITTTNTTRVIIGWLCGQWYPKNEKQKFFFVWWEMTSGTDRICGSCTALVLLWWWFVLTVLSAFHFP